MQVKGLEAEAISVTVGTTSGNFWVADEKRLMALESGREERTEVVLRIQLSLRLSWGHCYLCLLFFVFPPFCFAALFVI